MIPAVASAEEVSLVTIPFSFTLNVWERLENTTVPWIISIAEREWTVYPRMTPTPKPFRFLFPKQVDQFPFKIFPEFPNYARYSAANVYEFRVLLSRILSASN